MRLNDVSRVGSKQPNRGVSKAAIPVILAVFFILHFMAILSLQQSGTVKNDIEEQALGQSRD
ncbi:hypothetical protein [Bradyrhizobium guangdongense]|uniref:Uncharacterized protein n=1 Tax=Bradyrhizobium guangdongense TaxID=1325090 RepID=A0AA88BC84_9BRAD|nr:hypothetical protein [Bradyrhizobium guangdongense]GGI32900.1 hypothetical protein GCM10010987_71710 [Bradyrhizobium guangdongense]